MDSPADLWQGMKMQEFQGLYMAVWLFMVLIMVIVALFCK